MAKELTPAQYEKMVAEGKIQTSSKNNNLALIIIGVVVLCAASFFGGVQYQKSHNHSTATAPGSGFGGGRFGSGQRPSIGQVTAVAADSITVNNQRTGASQTFKVTSATTVTNSGAAAAITDIKVGDTVFVQADSSDATTASRIMLNPSFGGGASGAGDSSQTDNSGD